ncbi:MAG: peptidoglycan DD-metalloendopeptidase family protein [Candidatus Caccovivens sp.]
MEIKNENKFKTFFKRYGVLTVACVFSLVLALAIGLSVKSPTDQQPVSTQGITFGLPMNNAVVVKDYADDHLQYNASMKRWEIHLSIDLASENCDVFSVADGVVASVDSNSLEGYIIKIEHQDGFVSIYSSLDEQLNVKAGDIVNKGQKLGVASSSATNESQDGGHLHFTLLRNGVEVDPNNYLDLQNK